MKAQAASRGDVRVLLIDPSSRGGIRAYTRMVADALVACGAEAQIVTATGSGPSPANVPELRVLPVQEWGRPSGAGVRFVARRFVAWLISSARVHHAVRRQRPDVVHFQAGLNRRLDAALVRRLRRRAAVVWTAHDVLPFERTAADERRFASIYRAVDRVVVHNEPAARSVRRLAGVTATVVPHPLPVSETRLATSDARAALGLPPDERLLLAAGFVRAYKGYDLLADVWESLGDTAPQLLVVGEALSAEAKAVLARLERCRNVTVRAGYVPDDEFRLFVAAADAVVLPYREASDSGVLHLARAQGVPVIASDVEQLAAVVEQTSAGRVVPRTVAAWRSAVLDELPPPPPAPGRAAEDVGRDHLAVYAQALSARTGRALRLLTYIDATEIGGAEHSLATLIRAFDPEIAVTVAGVDARVVEWIAAHRPGTTTAVLRPVRGKFDVARILEHVRKVRALRPQVLQAHLRHPWSCQYGILAGVVTPGVAVVAVELAIVGTASALQRRLKRWTSARLDAHVACGDRAARLVEEAASLPRGSIRTIYLGVEDAGAPPRPQGSTRSFRAGCLARLSREKCLDDAIRAVALLDDVELMLVGDGPERRSLEQLAHTLGVDGRVTFTGWRDDARSVLSELDAVLLPSRSEALPLVLVEAMLAELPVVATDVGSVAEAVTDGVTGLIVPVGSPQAIADAVEVLRGDPELRRRMGEEGRRLALERFDPRRSAHAFTTLYHEVLR